MKSVIFKLGIVVLLMLSQGCATIVSKSIYNLTINTNPVGAEVVIKDHQNNTIFKSQSPVTVPLKAGRKFFTPASYLVYINYDGFNQRIIPVQFKLDNWYFGNIIFGGFLGLLVIDPITGAMYKLENEFIQVDLEESKPSDVNNELRIYKMEEIPENWKEHLVKMED